jgi:hypothetical protein
MEDKFNEMQAECDEYKAKIAEFKKKAEDAEMDKKKAEDEAEDGKAKNMIATFVAQGRIKADAVNDWAATSKAVGFEKAKAMLEALPMHKASARIDISNVSNEAVLTNVVASAMANIREKNKL